MKVEISNGDLLDKISILEIKMNKFEDGSKKENVQKELKALVESAVESSLEDWLLSDEYKELLEVNSALWLIEDAIRQKEAAQQFDEEFVELARSVYLVNDERAAIKKRINEETNSLIVEEKQYVDYSKAEEDESTD